MAGLDSKLMLCLILGKVGKVERQLAGKSVGRKGIFSSNNSIEETRWG